MHKVILIICSVFLVVVLLQTSACKHYPNMPIDDMMPIDTTGTNGGGGGVDTMVVNNPCDPDKIYFQQDILPILVSNCALSGCHDPASAQDGVILTNYDQVVQTADVEAFDLGGSELYEVITETDPDKRMPPAPNAPLNSQQINLIAKWILEGALDLTCDPDTVCNTTGIGYNLNVRPIVETYCQGCHSGSSPSGGIDLSTHAGAKTVADNGRLFGAISWDPTYENMPQGGEQLPQCSIDQIKAWIDDGAPNN